MELSKTSNGVHHDVAVRVEGGYVSAGCPWIYSTSKMFLSPSWRISVWRIVYGFCRVPPEEERFLQHKSDTSKRPQFTDVSVSMEVLIHMLCLKQWDCVRIRPRCYKGGYDSISIYYKLLVTLDQSLQTVYSRYKRLYIYARLSLYYYYYICIIYILLFCVTEVFQI